MGSITNFGLPIQEHPMHWNRRLRTLYFLAISYFIGFLIENSWKIQMLAETTVVQDDESKVFSFIILNARNGRNGDFINSF